MGACSARTSRTKSARRAMSPSMKRASPTSKCAFPASSRKSSLTPPINTSGRASRCSRSTAPTSPRPSASISSQNTIRRKSHSTVPGVAWGAASLLDAAIERLKQWQVPQSEIDRLETTGKWGRKSRSTRPPRATLWSAKRTRAPPYSRTCDTTRLPTSRRSGSTRRCSKTT